MWKTIDVVLTYGTQFIGALVALIALYKERDEYLRLGQRRPGRALYPIMWGAVLVLLVAGLIQTYHSRSEAQSKQAGYERDRMIGNALLEQANTNLENLQGKVSELQTKAETQALSRELSKTQKELAEARSQLEGPKAHFLATFASSDYSALPIAKAVGERLDNGSIRFTIGVLNASETAAKQGDIVVQICDACTYAGEPTGLIRVPNEAQNERIRNFDIIQAKSVVQDMTITINPPFGFGAVTVAVYVKCLNCAPANPQILTVALPTSQIFPTKMKSTKQKGHQ